MKTKTKEIYIADDGKEFTSEIECANYELVLKEEEKTTSYWQIVNKPDLTEGRGHYGLIFAKVRVGQHYDSPKLMLEDYCYRNFGRPVSFIQGHSPIENWMISKIDKKKWVDGGSISVGSYSYKGTYLDLVMGERETGLINKPSEKSS